MKLKEVAKNAEKHVSWFKVIQSHRVCHHRKGICNFLLMVNSNLGRISQGFGDTATYWSKRRL